MDIAKNNVFAIKNHVNIGNNGIPLVACVNVNHKSAYLQNHGIIKNVLVNATKKIVQERFGNLKKNVKKNVLWELG